MTTADLLTPPSGRHAPRNSLKGRQRRLLGDWLLALPPERLIGARPEDLAAGAAVALGFYVTPHNVEGALEDVDLTIKPVLLAPEEQLRADVVMLAKAVFVVLHDPGAVTPSLIQRVEEIANRGA